TILDGEIVALDPSGRPSFNMLQNYEAVAKPLFYYVFDLLMLRGRELIVEPLSVRRHWLRRHILPSLHDPIRECPELDAPLPAVIRLVRAQGLEGIVAKNLDSAYEPGRR